MARRMSEILFSPIKAVHEKMEEVGARVADYLVPSAGGDQWLENYLASPAATAAPTAPVASPPVPAPVPAPVSAAPAAGEKRAKKSPAAPASNKKAKLATKAPASNKKSKSPTVKQVRVPHSYRAVHTATAACCQTISAGRCFLIPSLTCHVGTHRLQEAERELPFRSSGRRHKAGFYSEKNLEALVWQGVGSSVDPIQASNDQCQTRHLCVLPRACALTVCLSLPASQLDS